VTVSELEDNLTREAEERDRRRESDRSLYRQVLTALTHTVTALAAGESVDAVALSRTVAPFIERLSEEPEAILALAQMTGHGERWRFHAVAVMLYSLYVGQALGLTDQETVSLGLSALTHDLGEVLRPGDVDPEDGESAHPVAGARALGALIEEDCLHQIVAYEHHMGTDGSGWPARAEGHVPHPYSRMVSVADRYDGLIRPAEGRGARPDEAVARLLIEASEGPLDLSVVRVLLGGLGPIPIGSVVRVSDHCVGVVQAPGDDPLAPAVQLVLASDGTELRPSIGLDLAQDDRDVVQVLPAWLLGIDPSEYL
jgi:HD-GYP domain-containing protein (c-di-GMP phosphodiesterase class II)